VLLKGLRDAAIFRQRGAKNAILREVLEGSASEKPPKPLFGAPVVALGRHGHAGQPGQDLRANRRGGSTRV
jgi:hypothetical protein